MTLGFGTYKPFGPVREYQQVIFNSEVLLYTKEEEE
jgi:hypothetical protein